MSRIAPHDHEPVEATPRRYISRKTLAVLRERQRWTCARCDKQIAEWDHVIPLELGGAHSEANLMGLCSHHHRIKTAKDIKAIAKARRIRRKLAGENKRSRKSAGRPLGAGPLRRKMSGQVVPR